MTVTQSSAPAQLVREFQSAISKGDAAAARRLLADDLHFKGPLDEFRRAEDYIAALTRLAKIVKGMESVRVFADGEYVGVFYDLVTNTPAGTSPTAELYRVRSGKIAEIRAIFDARPFAAMFSKQG